MHFTLVKELSHWLSLMLSLFFLLSSSISLKSQEALKLKVDSIYKLDIENEIKIEGVTHLLSLQDLSMITSELGYTYHKLGLLYDKTAAYRNAIEQTLKAVAIRKSLNGSELRSLNNSLFNISIYLRKDGRAYEGEQYLNEILKNESKDKFNYKALNSLALLKANKGDYFEALAYLEKLIETIDKEEFPSIFVGANRESIRVYSEMPNPERYIDEITEFEKTLRDFELNAEEMVNVNNNLGVIRSQMGHNPKAIEYYLKAMEVYRLQQDSIRLGGVLNNLGSEYSLLNQFDKANLYFDEALKYADQTVRADVYDNQGYYLYADEPKQRLRLYQKAINTVLNEEGKTVNISALPELNTIEESTNRLAVLFFLIDKATAWGDLFESEKDSQYLIEAKETLYLIDQLVSVIRLDSESEQSKLFWINRGVDSYVLAVKVCFLLDAPADAFYFMEKNKSLLLLENLEKGSEAKTKFLNISSLNDAIENHVSEQSNLLEFILNKKEGFGLFCSENAIHFFELNNVPDLIVEINHLKKIIKRPFTEKHEFEEFEELSNSVFNKLFPFERSFSEIRDKRLTVIPDYQLHSLPFELLVTQKNERTFEKSYLINTTETAYLHSCSVYGQIEKSDASESTPMIGFVPTTFQDDNLSNLELSEAEMKTIASFFPSKLMIREQATKAVFIESLDKYNIIHVNSHAGYTENSTPWLSFYDQKVSLEELTTYKNHSSLVILDACKSALGEQELGEGIMSLSRAFFYGGSASVIASQWQVNEKSSGEIFNEFYKNLKAGESKSQALHHAKLTYLASNQLAQLSPYYWASFTLTGDTGHVAVEEDNGWLKTVIIILSALLLLIFGRKLFS